MNTEFAAALNDQGRFANTSVAGFDLTPRVGRHIWKGKTAKTMAELAEQVNEGLKSLADFGSPYITLEIISVEGLEASPVSIESSEAPTPDSIKSALVDSNKELQKVIDTLPTPPRPSLTLVNQ